MLFNFEASEVSFEVQEDSTDEEWKILPQQSPCKVLYP